jgi:hypothetical protein
MIQKVFNSAAQASPVAATESDQKETRQSLKAKTLGFSVRDQRALHGCVMRARREPIMENAVALCFRLVIGVAAPSRGFTHAVPPRLLPLAAANSRPKQVQK